MTGSSTALYVMAHPLRQEIIKLLRAEGALPLEEIAELLDFPENVVTFHLGALEQHGFVTGNFDLGHSEQPRALMYYEVTEKVREVIEACGDLLD